MDIKTDLASLVLNEPIQDLIFKIDSKKIDKTLFINAWDPFSIIGNGNANDNTLDGYFGRITAMSVLGWSMTNPHVKFESVF